MLHRIVTYPSDIAVVIRMFEAIIVTFYNGLNYGSMLQAAALHKVLRKLGVESRFLDRFQVMTFILVHPSLLVTRVHRKLTETRRKRFFLPTDYVKTKEKQNRLAEFEVEETPVISFTDHRLWRGAIHRRTVFIAGSDITWNPANGIPGKYFLDFAVAAGLPCFSYAASIGAKALPKKWGQRYRHLLGEYLAVGVREHESIALLRPYYDGHIEQVVDPTLLLTAVEWDVFANKAALSVNVKPDSYILCYFVMDDDRYWDYAKHVQDYFCLPVIVLPMHAADGVGQNWIRVEDAAPYEFVWLVKNATVVLTDSFHACSFCLTYEKEFYLLRRERKAEDSKYNDFLSRYSLESRVVTNESHFERALISYSDETLQVLERDRERSMRFLLETIAKAAC